MEATRRATREDASELDRLTRLAIDDLASQRGGALWLLREARIGSVADLLDAIDGNSHRRCILGTLDEVPVGYALGHIEQLRDGSRLAVVDELYVEAQARDVGLGEALLGDLVAWAEQQGCRGIDAFALPGNRDAKNLFEREGLTARAILVHRTLDSGTQP